MCDSSSLNYQKKEHYYHQHCSKMSEINTVDDISSPIRMYLTKFDPKTINECIQRGCNYYLPHFKICIEVIIEYEDRNKKNDFSAIREMCFRPYIIIRNNRMNKLIQFAPHSEFIFLKKYSVFYKQNVIEVYQYKVYPKNNSIMIKNFEISLKEKFRVLFTSHTKNLDDDLLIKFNCSDDLIEIYLLLISFLSHENIKNKEEINIIYKSIISKIDSFLNEKRFNFFIKLIFFYNLVEYLNLEQEITMFELKIESFNLFSLLEKKIKEVEKNPYPDGNVHYYYLNKILKRFQKILVINKNMHSEIEFDSVHSKLTEMLVLTKVKCKMLKEMAEKALIGDLDSVLNVVIKYQNVYGEDIFSNMSKRYLEVKSYLNSNSKPFLILFKKIEELTIFFFENYFQILNLKKNIYLFLHELLIINMTNKFVENSFILATLIILSLRKDLIETNVNEIRVKKEKIYSFSVNYILLIIETYKEDFLKRIMGRINDLNCLKKLLVEIEEIIEKCRAKDYIFFEKAMKLLNLFNLKDEPAIQFDINNNNKKTNLKLISSFPFVENSVIKSNDLIILIIKSLKTFLIEFEAEKKLEWIIKLCRRTLFA